MKIKSFKFNEILKPVSKEYRTKKWVMWGEKNDYPDWLIDLYEGSSIHSTIIRSKMEQVVGEGVRSSTDSSVVNEYVNSEMETLDELLKKVTLDYVIFGSFALNIIWTNDRSNFEIYHIDFSKVRYGKKDEEDNITEYFYTTNWQNTRKYPPKEYESFNPKGNENPETIYVYRSYTPGKSYYPNPDYIGTIASINLDMNMVKFHDYSISNGLTPSLHINIPERLENEELLELEREIEENFTGIDGRRVMVSSSDGPENKISIEPINISVNDNYYQTIMDLIKQNILSGHRITSPLLLGIRDTGGGLGSNKDEILVSYEHFYRTCIRPYQQDIMDCFNKIYAVKNGGESPELYFEPYKLFEDETEGLDENITDITEENNE